MSRGNEHPNAKSVREHNAGTFQKFKKKLVDDNLLSDPVRWVKTAHTLIEFVSDARIYYDEARSDIVDCVEIATNAVQNRVPAELRHLRPITLSHLPEAYRPAYHELKRLLVVVGSYQPEMLLPLKGGESRPDLLSRITSCVAASGIDPDSLLDKTSLEAAMQSVVIDDKHRQNVLKSIAKRKTDAASVVSSARSTPSIATPVLSVASPHSTASPQVVPIAPTAYPGPTPIPMHVAAPHVPSQTLAQQPLPSPTTPTGLVPSVRSSTGASKPRKQPKWMVQDLDKYRKEKMANSGNATATLVAQQPMSPVVAQLPVATQVQRPAAPPIPAPAQSPVAPIVSASPITALNLTAPAPAPNHRTSDVETSSLGEASAHHPMQVADTRSPEVTEVNTQVSDAKDVDTSLLDEPAPSEDKPLPYTLPPRPYPYPSTPTWGDLCAEAINAAHDHKLSIGDMIRYISTVYSAVYPTTAGKGTKFAIGGMFNSKLAKQTGKATVLAGTVADELRVASHWKPYEGPRFVKTTDVYPVTWTLEGSEETNSDTSNSAPGETEADASGEPVPAVAVKEEPPTAPAVAPVVASEEGDISTNNTAPDTTHTAPARDTQPRPPYTLRPGPYSPTRPTKALPVLIQEAILAGTPDKALSQSDIIAYIRTVYPFYGSTATFEDEVAASLQQYFALKDDGRWSLWIRDGSDEERPTSFALPPGPRSSAKPDKPLLDLVREAVSASNEGFLTQRDVAAYVLSVAPYYNVADEPLPFGQLLQDHFVEHESDAEGRVLWCAKDETPIVEVCPLDDVERDDSRVIEDAEPMTGLDTTEGTQSDSRSSSRPPKYKGPSKSAAVVDSDDDSDIDLPVTPSTITINVPASVTPPVKVAKSRAPRPSLSASQLFVIPPGPYTTHKPPKTNDAVVLEAFRASKAGELRKKEVVLYIQTVYPWFRRDERAILTCKKMVEHALSRLKGVSITRIATGLYRFNGVENDPGTSTSRLVQNPNVDDAAQPSMPKATRSGDSPVLKIRIPARQVSGDGPSSGRNKRSAPPSARSVRSESPSLPKRIKLILPDRPGAVPPSMNDEAPKTPLCAASVDSAPTKTNGIHVPELAATETKAAVTEQPDVEMQDSPEVMEVPGPPPLPPVSFGQDACLVDVAFGRPASASFALHVNPHPGQWAMLERWRNAARNDYDLSEALCYSIACYRSEDVLALKDDVAADAWGKVLVRTEIPVSLHAQALHSLCLTGNGRTVPFPLTWMSGTASPLFLDISPYLVSGDNVLTLAHTTDLSAFTFVIVAHRPNAHQLRWLDGRREPWRRLQAQLSSAMQVPQFDYGELLLSSKDVPKVDLEHGVPQALFTLS